MVCRSVLNTLIDLTCSEDEILRFKNSVRNIDFSGEEPSKIKNIYDNLKKTESTLPFTFLLIKKSELFNPDALPTLFLKSSEQGNGMEIFQFINGFYNRIGSDGVILQKHIHPAAVIRELNHQDADIIEMKVNQIQYLDDEIKKDDPPLQKLIHLLKKEKSDIYKIIYYSIFSGLTSLIVPLGIQSLINFLQLGRFSASGYLLIFLIIFGVLISGLLRIFQLWILEVLQQKLFAGMSFDFMHHITKIRHQNLKFYNPLERMNRLIDVLTLQKNLSSVLIDLSASLFQIIFGLIILCFYHPFFIAFSIFLFLLVMFIIRYTGKTGLNSSIKASTFKYKTLHWLQQMARSHDPIRSYEYTNIHNDKLDGFVSEYIVYRKKHFNTLLLQYFSFLGFSIIITGGLLIGGYILLINESISLGQFLASEIIVLMITGAIEKLIMKIESVYQMITAAEKITQVKDIAGEPHRGLLKPDFSKGIKLELIEYSSSVHEPKMNFIAEPGGCKPMEFNSRSSINALTDVILGIRGEYYGEIKINDINIKLIDAYWLNKHTTIFFNKEVLFDATVRENITLLNPEISENEIIEIFQFFGYDSIFENNYHNLDSEIIGSNYHWGQNTTRILLLARCILQKPKLLFIDELLLPGNVTAEKVKSFVMKKSPEANIILIKKKENET
ncbi:MAG: ABC transporter ATP-binding protein/permease [Bacteroidia bacterium]|nr:ABC transporter ATP-binding protein/permease [Bacteroidia bacterium]